MLSLIIKCSVRPQYSGVEVEDLGNGFYVIYLEQSMVDTVYSDPRIEYIESPKDITYYKDNFVGDSVNCVDSACTMYINASTIWASDNCFTATNNVRTQHSNASNVGSDIACSSNAYSDINYTNNAHISSLINADIDSGELSGQGVYIAIIDSGIDASHTQFGNVNGSRIKYLWDQTSNEGLPPKGFVSGTEYSGDNIPHKNLDSNGHGTAVASIASGGRVDGDFLGGVAYQSDIIAVKLDTQATTSIQIMRAMRYCLDRAIQDNKPLVINLSVGTNDGSHTGESLFERYVDAVTTMYRCSVVVASGNEGSSNHHYYTTLKNGDIASAGFVVDKYLKSITLSLWYNYNDEFDIRIVSPSNEFDQTLGNSIGKVSRYIDSSNNKLSIDFVRPSYNRLIAEIRITISGDRVPLGNYKLYIIPKKILIGRVNIWMPATGVGGVSSIFEYPDPRLSATLPSTATNVVSVGGYDKRLVRMADFSGRGDMSYLGRVLPDVVAPAVDVICARSGGGYTTYSGTSFAAPYVSGVVALLMEWGIVRGNDRFLYGMRIKAVLQKSAIAPDNQTVPNDSWGYGIVDIDRAKKEAISINR